MLSIFILSTLVVCVSAKCNCGIVNPPLNANSDVEGNPDFEIVDFNSFNESINNTNDLTIGALGSAYIKIYSKYCYGYKVYVNGKYKLTENGDGYCAFYIPCNQQVTIKLVKDGCSYQKTRYIYCGYTYGWEIDENWCKNCNGDSTCNVWTDKNEYRVGETVTIYFSPTPAYGVAYWLIVYKPDGSKFKISLQVGQKYATIIADQTGQYKVEMWAEGVYPGAVPGLCAYTYFTVKKTVGKCCPCQVYTDKSSYQAGELVTIKVKFCQGSSYCNPSNFKVYIYMPNKVQDITYSFRKVSTGVYKSQGYAECPAGKRTIKVVKSGCNPIYAYYEVKPDKCNPKARIKIKSDYCYGYDVYVNGKFKFTENGDGYCAFDIPCNQYVTITLKKNGRTISKEFYSNCGKTYEWRITKNWCSKPDLVIDKIWWDGEPKEGDNVKIHVRVKNVGNGDAESSYTKLEVDGESLGIKYTNSLSVGETETLTFNWKADKCGDVTVKAIADYYDDVDEENEDNNEKSVKLYVECYDLILKKIENEARLREKLVIQNIKSFAKKMAEVDADLYMIYGDKYVRDVINSYGYLAGKVNSEDLDPNLRNFLDKLSENSSYSNVDEMERLYHFYSQMFESVSQQKMKYKEIKNIFYQFYLGTFPGQKYYFCGHPLYKYLSYYENNYNKAVDEFMENLSYLVENNKISYQELNDILSSLKRTNSEIAMVKIKNIELFEHHYINPYEFKIGVGDVTVTFIFN